MAFNKFDPHRPDDELERGPAERRALLLKYGWWITLIYTAVGFGFIALWIVK